jgi:hypothetical protein
MRLIERGHKDVECQLRGVSRGLRQAADGRDYILSLQLPGCMRRLSTNQFGQGRSTGHRRDAALGLESDINDLVALQLQAQADDVPAHRILDLRRRIGVGDLAGIARILKVIEQLRRIHFYDSNQRGGRVPAMRNGLLDQCRQKTIVEEVVEEHRGRGPLRAALGLKRPRTLAPVIARDHLSFPSGK